MRCKLHSITADGMMQHITSGFWPLSSHLDSGPCRGESIESRVGHRLWVSGSCVTCLLNTVPRPCLCFPMSCFAHATHASCSYTHTGTTPRCHAAPRARLACALLAPSMCIRTRTAGPLAVVAVAPRRRASPHAPPMHVCAPCALHELCMEHL